jgi:hypothetical protein
MIWLSRQLWELICICETVICGMLFTYGHPIPVGFLLHCDFPLTLSCISISCPNVVGAVACANWSNSGWMTALTINMAVLDLKSYKWCKMNNRSHSTSGCSREHVSPCFEYKGRQWNKYREWCTKADLLHITVTYLTATINRKTLKGEPETVTDGSSQARHSGWVDRSGYWLGLPTTSGSGYWTGLELNRIVFPVQTRTADALPRPIAYTTHRSLEACSQTLKQHSKVLLKRPTVMEVHWRCNEIRLIG